MATASPPASHARPRVLFVDRDGASPQIAAGLMEQVAGDRVEVSTAITEPADPGGRSDEMLVGMGLNPSDHHRLNSGALYAADRVVVLTTGLDVARISGAAYEEWDLAGEDLGQRITSLSDNLTTINEVEPRLTPLDRVRNLLRTFTRR
ncbi:MAG TPA: hypothetical protein VIT20_06905 [Propionibacteriaceae bacterium]